jgi:hypothetical protein
MPGQGATGPVDALGEMRAAHVPLPERPVVVGL